MTREEAISRIQQALSVPDRLQGLVLIDEESANMAIEALSAERTGEWKIWNEPGNECVYCTKCKHEYDQIDLYIGGSEYPNFCPNCGAKMDMEE